MEEEALAKILNKTFRDKVQHFKDLLHHHSSRNNNRITELLITTVTVKTINSMQIQGWHRKMLLLDSLIISLETDSNNSKESRIKVEIELVLQLLESEMDSSFNLLIFQ